MSCRTKSTKGLARRFRSPADAEKHYLSLIAPLPEVQSPSLSATSSGEPLLAPSPQLEMTTEETTSYCHQALVPLQAGQQLEILSELFSLYLSENSRTRAVPHDFLELVVQGMRHLQEAGRSNVIYSLAKAVGTMRPDDSDSLLPTKNMPMGLIEYAVNFFTASSVQKVMTACSCFLPRRNIQSLCSSYRFLAPLTTVPGCRPCMSFLEPSGPRYSQVQCGATCPSCKLVRAEQMLLLSTQ